MRIAARYDAPNQCVLTHEEGHVLRTDTPRDLGGDATAFSPTELMGAALVACILTTIGLFGARRGLDLTGMTATVDKEMSPTTRRIGRLAVTVALPAAIPDELRPVVEKVGFLCPIHASLHPEIDAPIDYVYR